jgi:hypothetical protein
MHFGLPPLVERRWHGRVGQGIAYDAARFDQWPPRGAELEWGRLRAYGRGVHAALREAMETLTAAHLAAPVDMSRAGLGQWTGRDILALHGWRHVKIHGGEIAVLKGLQGALGYGPAMPRSPQAP